MKTVVELIKEEFFRLNQKYVVELINYYDDVVYTANTQLGDSSTDYKTLVVKYNFKFTEEEALEATKKYIESFNGNYRFMQLLKYFILKSDPNTGDIKSDFMSLIENKDDIEIKESDFCDIR